MYITDQEQLPTTYTIRCTFIHRSSRIVILLRLLNERLSCTEMYISDEALVEHSVSYLVQKCTLQILYINVHNRSRTITNYLYDTMYLHTYLKLYCYTLKLLNERLSCTEMYILDEAPVEHWVSYLVHKCTLQILYINVHNRSRTRCISYYRNCRTVDVDDSLFDATTLDNNISSVVNKVGLLTIERMELFSCVDCDWYKSDAGSDFHRPMDMMFVGDTWAVRAIVGADMRNECVSNHVASRPNTVAACFTANCMSLYNKHFNCPSARYDKKGVWTKPLRMSSALIYQTHKRYWLTGSIYSRKPHKNTEVIAYVFCM